MCGKAIYEVHETRHCGQVSPEPLLSVQLNSYVKCAEVSHFCVCMCTVEEQICQEIFKLQHYRQIGITTFKGKP